MWRAESLLKQIEQIEYGATQNSKTLGKESVNWIQNPSPECRKPLLINCKKPDGYGDRPICDPCKEDFKLAGSEKKQEDLDSCKNAKEPESCKSKKVKNTGAESANIPELRKCSWNNEKKKCVDLDKDIRLDV